MGKSKSMFENNFLKYIIQVEILKYMSVVFVLHVIFREALEKKQERKDHGKWWN